MKAVAETSPFKDGLRSCPATHHGSMWLLAQWSLLPWLCAWLNVDFDLAVFGAILPMRDSDHARWASVLKAAVATGLSSYQKVIRPGGLSTGNNLNRWAV